ncbi:DNA topoisomerase III [Halomonas denitrificans]|uniref:DNA topoisomerase III n=1 Tax=Halomonas denitrificans TaxID=370769 RepID=UPI001CD582FD|nr:DNA topoisomerase III [Halomonas denitrificans]MCA0976353.1 DNA topoisomerase III [Halomonas denitrificans]
MRLIIAEKPSLARAIADALPGAAQKHDGYLSVGDTEVTWCLGHLLEQAPPDAYDPALKPWRRDHLPIVPSQWKLVPRPKARGQLAVIRARIKRASQLVHAGDPDREGQLLVQEVIEHLGWKGDVARLLINDLNRPAVVRALSRIGDNRHYHALYRAAQTRARADWLYGINLTRAWTLIGRQAGHDGVLSVGRVQTPVLGLVVRRDEEIRQFVPYPFHVLWAEVRVAAGTFKAWWVPSEQHRLDERGRLLDEAPAQALAARLPGSQGVVTKVESRHRRQPPPLPYSLSALQVDAARRHGLSAKAVLDICQRLYERHQLITYPRSDCRYLPREHLKSLPGQLASACRDDATLGRWLANADMQLRSRAFDDSKVGAHHALAPTGKPFSAERLSAQEADVYRLIARNVLAQFYPALETQEVKAECQLLDERFAASGQTLLVPGWKPLFTTRDEAPPLPALHQGETCQAINAEVEQRETRAPEPFTDASLIKAMMNIARYVEDAEVKRTLRDTDGLGTEATRAGIIETLIERGYLVRKAKTLRATRLGVGLIHSLPDAVSRPERTALWEQRLEDIAEARAEPDPFVSQLVVDLTALVASADSQRLQSALRSAQGEVVAATPAKRAGTRRRRSQPRAKKGTSARDASSTTSDGGANRKSSSGRGRRSPRKGNT